MARLRVFDENTDSARAVVASSAKAELVGSAEELVLADDLPALCIFLKDREAGEWNARALRAGKWVYGDKPGGQTAAELEDVVRAAEAAGTHFCPCYANRLKARDAGLKALFDQQAIGAPWSFEAVWMTSSVALRGPGSWLFHREDSAGGILTWLACHWIDQYLGVMKQGLCKSYPLPVSF